MELRKHYPTVETRRFPIIMNDGLLQIKIEVVEGENFGPAIESKS